MYVCICHAVTEKAVIKAAEEGATTLEALGEMTRAGTCCGRCKPCAQEVLDQVHAKENADERFDLGMAV